MKDEIEHEKFADISDSDHVISMCITSRSEGRQLWCAAEKKGLLQFEIVWLTIVVYMCPIIILLDSGECGR